MINCNSNSNNNNNFLLFLQISMNVLRRHQIAVKFVSTLYQATIVNATQDTS